MFDGVNLKTRPNAFIEKPVIKIWPFQSAPEEYRVSQGGDEDWVVFIPDNVPVPGCFEEWVDDVPYFGMATHIKASELNDSDYRLIVFCHA